MGSHISAIIHYMWKVTLWTGCYMQLQPLINIGGTKKATVTKLLLLHLMESWCKLVVDFDLVVEVTTVNFTKVFNHLFHIRAHVGSQRVSTKSL